MIPNPVISVQNACQRGRDENENDFQGALIGFDLGHSTVLVRIGFTIASVRLAAGDGSKNSQLSVGRSPGNEKAVLLRHGHRATSRYAFVVTGSVSCWDVSSHSDRATSSACCCSERHSATCLDSRFGMRVCGAA